MRATTGDERLAIGAIAAGAVAGLAAYLGLPAFEGYVGGVMGLVSGVAPLGPRAPGVVLALVVAFLVGLSMNFLPCNVPIVMSLLPTASGAESRGAFFRRTLLYGLGAVAILGALGAVLGAAGATLKPVVLDYPAIGAYVAAAVVGGVGLLSVAWGLREVGVVAIPTLSLPFVDALRAEVDRQSGASEYVLLGAVYGGTGGGCPMPTYHLLLVWIVVTANALFGAALLVVYVLGRVLPVAALGAVLHERPVRAAELFGGRYDALRLVNGATLLGFGSLLIVFTGLRAIAGGG